MRTRLFPHVRTHAIGSSSSITVWHDHEISLIPGVAGNKARKLAELFARPNLPSTLVSHGGAQSNAMVAIAAVAAHRGVSFRYHTRPVPKWLRATPTGNFRRALAMGMDHVEHRSADAYTQAWEADRGGEGFVPQGAASPLAEAGVAALAREIGEWRDAARTPSAPLTVVVPAGTGTTAAFLARHAPAGVRVFAVPCVGSDTYLREQMRALVKDGAIAEVLMPPPPLRVQFAEPAHSVLGAWNEACAAGVLLDLVYGPIAWAAAKQLRLGDPIDRGGSGPHDSEVLLLNTGGQEGLHTQLARYRRERQLVVEPAAALQAAIDAAGLERSSLWFDDEPA